MRRYVSNKQVRTKERDEVFFEHIWNTRPHLSEVSLTPLNYEFGKTMFFVFSHVLAKGTYPQFRHYTKNIVLMTLEEHQEWEFRDQKSRELQFVSTMKEVLKEEYYKHAKNNFLFFKNHFQ